MGTPGKGSLEIAKRFDRAPLQTVLLYVGKSLYFRLLSPNLLYYL